MRYAYTNVANDCITAHSRHWLQDSSNKMCCGIYWCRIKAWDENLSSSSIECLIWWRLLASQATTAFSWTSCTARWTGNGSGPKPAVYPYSSQTSTRQQCRLGNSTVGNISACCVRRELISGQLVSLLINSASGNHWISWWTWTCASIRHERVCPPQVLWRQGGLAGLWSLEPG